MRLIKYCLALLALLLIIPLAAAQERHPNRIVLEEDTSLDSLFAEYGCPVGIRDSNRNLEYTDAGLLTAGQTIVIPDDSPLCALDYRGEIKFLSIASLAHAEETSPNPRSYLPMSELAAAQNVCESSLREFNPDWLTFWQRIGWEWFYLETNADLDGLTTVRIPLELPPCFQTVELAAGQHPRDLAASLNICEYELWYYNPDSLYQASNQARDVYIPLDYLPCSQDGQIRHYLGYPNQWGDYIPVDTVLLEQPISIYKFATSNGYCVNDLDAYNRQESLAPLRAGDAVYIPVGVQHCAFEQMLGKTALEISREYNVCLESLINQNGGFNSWSYLIGQDTPYSHSNEDAFYMNGIFVPLDDAPCYDANGLRIGHNDRAVHESSKDDSVFAIAQHYEVCIEQLIAANPLMKGYPQYEVPSLIFIPDVAPCSDVASDGFVHYAMTETITGNAVSQKITELSYLYNICPNAILEANPAVVNSSQAGYTNGWLVLSDISNVVTSYWLNDVEAGTTLLLPANQPPCYDFYAPLTGIGNYYQMYWDTPIQIDYVCYAEAVDPNTDYTGHEPVISPIVYREGAYCYDRLSNPQVVLNNVTYTLYPWMGDAFPFELADCFGVNGYELILIHPEELGIKSGDYYSHSFWGIPNASRDCPLVGNDREAALSWKRNFYQSAVFGTLNEAGEYGVTYGDTLSSIGRRYGYLPEWIMAENNMSDEWVYPYQRLRLPNYPNIYQMATYGGVPIGGLLLFFGGTFALRLRAKGRKGKKKNDE